MEKILGFINMQEKLEKLLCFLKMCPMFVGSVDQFGMKKVIIHFRSVIKVVFCFDVLPEIQILIVVYCPH